MEKTNCGNCNWHDEIQQKKTYCLIDDQWYDVSHSCENFLKYSYINREDRAERAREFRKRLESGAREQREKEEATVKEQREREFAGELARKDREHASELQQVRMTFDKKLWRASWWWQLILIVVSAGLGFLGAWILKP